jgi:hypothetical protein
LGGLDGFVSVLREGYDAQDHAQVGHDVIELRAAEVSMGVIRSELARLAIAIVYREQPLVLVSSDPKFTTASARDRNLTTRGARQSARLGPARARASFMLTERNRPTSARFRCHAVRAAWRTEAVTPRETPRHETLRDTVATTRRHAP